jgi:tetratricopeptide (TPR) repeat protein
MNAHSRSALLLVLVGLVAVRAGSVPSDPPDSSAEAIAIEEEISADPENVVLIVRAGNLYYDMKEWERARAWYLRALDLNAANADVLTDLGVVHRNLGQHDAALVAFNGALGIEPNHWQAMYNKAIVLGHDLGRQEDALRLVDALEKLSEENSEIPDLADFRASLSAAPVSPIPTDKLEDIRRLVEISGMGEVSVLVMNNLLEQFRTTFPDVPSDFWDELSESFDPGEFVGMFTPVYDKYFTHQDVLELIEFYETPIGQKLIRTQPLITNEAMEIGRVWGERKAQEIIQRLQEEGHQPQSST